MLTFDSIQPPEDPMVALKKPLPDLIEIGETCDYWLFVRRSTRQIEFMSKVTGTITAKCAFGGSLRYGISKAQLKAAEAALAL